MPQIWSDTYIWQLHNDADNEICNLLDVVYQRFPLPITAGEAIYSLPAEIRKVESIWWKGKKVDPISYESMLLLQNTTTSSESRFYCFWPTGQKDIRFYPAPDADIYPSNPLVWSNLSKWQEEVQVRLDSNPPLIYTSGTLNILNEQLSLFDSNYADDYVVVGSYRLPTPSLGNADYQLPACIARRTKKAFVLAKAFAKEGPGQNLVAAKYFSAKFDFLIGRFKLIFDGCFVSKKYRMTGGFGQMGIGRRPPKPSLPSNFERVEY